MEVPSDDEQLMVAAVADRVDKKAAVGRKELKAAVEQDPVLQELQQQISGRWPSRHKDCPVTLQPYHRCRQELLVLDDLILRGERLVIPEVLRGRLLDAAHEGHQGMVRTKQRMRELYWWPGMDAAVEDHVKLCEACATADRTATPRNVPLTPVPLPETCWSKLGIDFIGPLEHGGVQKRFAIVMVDYYSKWPEVGFCSHPTCRQSSSSWRLWPAGKGTHAI